MGVSKDLLMWNIRDQECTEHAPQGLLFHDPNTHKGRGGGFWLYCVALSFKYL